MYENFFDQTLDEVSTVHGLDWDDDSKVRILARFLQHAGVGRADFEQFVEQQADEELIAEADDQDDNRCPECGFDCPEEATLCPECSDDLSYP